MTELFFLKDKFPSIRNLSVWVSSLDLTSTTQLNVSFNNVSLLKSTWKTYGLGLSGFNANLAKTEIYLPLGQYAMKKSLVAVEMRKMDMRKQPHYLMNRWTVVELIDLQCRIYCKGETYVNRYCTNHDS